MFTKLIRGLLVALGLAALFFAAIPPILYGIWHTGTLALGVVGAVCLLQAFLLGKRFSQRRPWEVFSNRGRPTTILRGVLGVVLILFLAAEAVFSACMIYKGWYNRPDYSQPDTAVVLGCDIRGDQPTLVLQRRLEQARDYLNAVPAAKVVVTGGLGEGHEYTEAYVEAKWLTEQGIAPERILLEDRSVNTYQNLQYAAELMAANNLPPRAVVCSDGFHQLRGQLYARVHGLTATGLPSATPWGLLPGYWVREQAAICAAWLNPQVRSLYLPW